MHTKHYLESAISKCSERKWIHNPVDWRRLKANSLHFPQRFVSLPASTSATSCDKWLLSKQFASVRLPFVAEGPCDDSRCRIKTLLIWQSLTAKRHRSLIAQRDGKDERLIIALKATSTGYQLTQNNHTSQSNLFHSHTAPQGWKCQSQTRQNIKISISKRLKSKMSKNRNWKFKKKSKMRTSENLTLKNAFDLEF